MDAEKILTYLSMVSNKSIVLNLAMHIVVFAAVISMFIAKNEKVRKIIINSSITILFLSVTINALIYGNPFHLITFLTLSIFAGVEIFIEKNKFKVPRVNINTIVSFALIAIGLWYPEFVNASKLQLLFLSPVGIVPCPTLLAAIGLLSLSYPQVNKLQYSITIVVGMVFGIIGTFVFKVYLDAVLLIAVGYGLINLYTLKAQNKKADLALEDYK